MMWKNPHSPGLERVENSIRQRFSAQKALHVRMNQNIHSATDVEFRVAIRTNACGLSFIDESGARLLNRVGDGRRFSVVKRSRSRTDNQCAKVLHRDITKAYDFHEFGIHEFIQAVGIIPSASSAHIKLSRYGIYNNQAARQGTNNRRGAPSRYQVNDDAGISHERCREVNQEG